MEQWRITVEHYPNADRREDQWYVEVWQSGELLDCTRAEDSEVLMYEACQIMERFR